MDGSAEDGLNILVTFPEGIMNRDEFVYIKELSDIQFSFVQLMDLLDFLIIPTGGLRL